MATSSAVFSQLYVAPNTSASTDSYLYVNNEVLFVEDDINLTENNNNPATKASIYLRGDSQLIQGTGTTPNSGTGYISVYQTVDETSNYHYNFWHSPVGNQTIAGNGNKNAGVSRLYDIVDITDSNLASTTTSWNGNATTSPITISTRWIYKRLSSPNNEQEANYVFVGGADNIEPGYGFTMKGVSNGAVTQSQTYDFRGRPNNGDINVPINAGNQWTLSGNPYPSAIDLVEFFNANTGNGLTEILFWDEPKNSEYSHYYVNKSGGYGVWVPGPANSGNTNPGSYTAPTFKTYSANGGLGGNAGTGTGAVIDRRYSPIGQGFVLNTNAGAATNIVHSNSHRLYTSTLNVRSSENNTETINGNEASTASESVEIPQMRINVVINNEYARQLLLMFSDESTDGYDVGLDGHHPMDSGGAESYFLIEENGELEPFVIQTLPYSNDKQIPLGFTLDETTLFNVKAVEIINFSRNAYLWDSLNDTYKLIDDQPQTELNSFYLPAGTYNNRFFIVFKNGRQVNEDSPKATETELVRASVNFFQNNPYKQMEISNPDGYTIKEATIYDMAGKRIIHKTNLGSATSFTIPTSNISDGVYLIKLLTDTNIDIDYKMIVKNK